jgi:amidase
VTTTDDLAADPAFADATECARAIRTRDVSSRELLDLLLERVDRLDGPINAVVTVDADAARARADDADRATAAGTSWGPLHGVPMTVKDVWETEGMRTTSGAPELADHVPATDALAVARLRAAGAVVFGKTNTPLYAGDIQTSNEVFGRTGNPWDVGRTPGGSSGGAAAAVAAGLTPLELGSDIGGSIRMPSHLCGTFGLKPTWGVVPSRGHIPGGPIETDVNQGGPMARSVRDLELGLDVLAGPVPEDATAWHLELPRPERPVDVAGLRIDVVLDDPDFPVSAEVRDLLRAGADRLLDAGARVEERPLPVPPVRSSPPTVPTAGRTRSGNGNGPGGPSGSSTPTSSLPRRWPCPRSPTTPTSRCPSARCRSTAGRPRTWS